MQLKSVLILLVLTFVYPSYAADLDAGKTKALSCSGCHGEKGNSKNPQFPILAGQPSMYLINQLMAFQSGERPGPMMQNMAKSLSKDDINNLAAFFSQSKAVSAGGNTKLAAKGKDKANMCMSCHAADLNGRSGIPKLAGQHPAYLEKQLKAFKQGDRVGGPMRGVASSLSEDDIKAIAAYLGTL